jgi:hypothetical protein
MAHRWLPLELGDLPEWAPLNGGKKPSRCETPQRPPVGARYTTILTNQCAFGNWDNSTEMTIEAELINHRTSELSPTIDT